MMLSFVGSFALLCGAAISSDPSLSPVAACGAPTAPQVEATSSEVCSDRLLLGHDGVVLFWNAASAMITLSIDGAVVGDLSTRSVSRFRSEFSGRFVDGRPTVTGSVDNPNGTTWSVEFTMPERKPATYIVQSAGDSIQILSGTICDCSDRVSLDCKSNADCNNAKKCNSQQTSTCRHYPIIIDPNL